MVKWRLSTWKHDHVSLLLLSKFLTWHLSWVIIHLRINNYSWTMWTLYYNYPPVISLAQITLLPSSFHFLWFLLEIKYFADCNFSLLWEYLSVSLSLLKFSSLHLLFIWRSFTYILWLVHYAISSNEMFPFKNSYFYSFCFLSMWYTIYLSVYLSIGLSELMYFFKEYLLHLQLYP